MELCGDAPCVKLASTSREPVCSVLGDRALFASGLKPLLSIVAPTLHFLSLTKEVMGTVRCGWSSSFWVWTAPPHRYLPLDLPRSASRSADLGSGCGGHVVGTVLIVGVWLCGGKYPVISGTGAGPQLATLLIRAKSTAVGLRASKRGRWITCCC